MRSKIVPGPVLLDWLAKDSAEALNSNFKLVSDGCAQPSYNPKKLPLVPYIYRPYRKVLPGSACANLIPSPCLHRGSLGKSCPQLSCQTVT